MNTFDEAVASSKVFIDPTQGALSHRWDMNVTFENHFHIPALSDRAYLYGVDNFLQEHFCKGL